MEWLTSVGLGLDYDALRLGRTTHEWIEAGERLRNHIARLLNGTVSGVEQIGSSSVLNLLAKPIIDVAIGAKSEHDFSTTRERLEAAGWIYRGDAGDNGGHVYVLETQPWHRVAHAHVVEFDGEQWRDYLRFRDLLRSSPTARARYESVKQQLAALFGDDRVAYTDGKTTIVNQLLNSPDPVT